MIGLVLLYVGAVLFVNGIWLLGKIQNREIAIINVFTGVVGFMVAVWAIAQGDILSAQLAAYVLLFAFTYLWVAYNQFMGVDGTGLGWYCLFVAITAVPVSVLTLMEADSIFLLWLGANWAAWAVLWFLYFLLLGLKRSRLTKPTAYITTFQGIATAWIPGFLVLNEFLAI